MAGKKDESAKEEVVFLSPETPMRRSRSMSSLASNDQVVNIESVLKKLRATLKKIEDKLEKNAHPGKQSIAVLRSFAQQIEDLDISKHREMSEMLDKNIALSERINSLQESLHEQKNNYQQLLQQIPTTEDITEALQQALSRKPTTAAATTSNTAQDTHTTNETNNTYSQVVTQRTRKKKLSNHTERNTLIIKGVSDITSADIDKELQHNKYAAPIQPQRIIRRRKQIEIECKTANDLLILKNDIHQHQALNRKLSAVPKALPQQKMILLQVPSHTTEDQIKTAVTTHYEVLPHEIMVLKTLQNRIVTETNDIILLMPKSLGHSIIEDGGLTLGLSTHMLRPHTTVPRCRKCQALTHIQRFCKREVPSCVNCGREHTDPNCGRPPRCVNCVFHNEQTDTNFDTHHKASDPSCDTYRKRYQEIRRQLDDEFTHAHRSSATTSQQLPSSQHQQQAQQGRDTTHPSRRDQRHYDTTRYTQDGLLPPPTPSREDWNSYWFPFHYPYHHEPSMTNYYRPPPEQQSGPRNHR